MKRLSTLLLAVTVLVAFTSTSFALPRTVEKLRDGAKDVITSPLQVKDHVMAETKEVKAHVLPFALVGGLLKGTFYMGKQIIDGAYTMVTSPLELTK